MYIAIMMFYRMFVIIERIGQRTDNCTRQSVLNCIADYPEWDSIGKHLIGLEVERIKHDPSMNGDQAAYMVEQWWRNSTNDDFRWHTLQDAIMKFAQEKYGRTILDERESSDDRTSNVNNNVYTTLGGELKLSQHFHVPRACMQCLSSICPYR